MATVFKKRKLSGFINNTNEKFFLKAVQCDRDALRFYHQLLLTLRADHTVPNRGKQYCTATMQLLFSALPLADPERWNK